MNNGNGFYKGAAWLTLSTLILKFIGMIYKIPISYILGDEGMGYFNSAYTVYTLFYIVGTAGIPKAISIMVSKNEAEYKNSSYSIYKHAFVFFFLAGTLLFLIFVLFGKTFAYHIGNLPAVLSMYAVAPSILFVCAGGVIRGYLTGKMRFAPIAVSELIAGGGKLVFGLVFAYIAARNALPLPMICAYTIFGITVGSFLSLIYLWLVVKSGEKLPRQAGDGFGKTIKSILKLSLPITLASALSGMANIFDLTLIMNGLQAIDYSSTVATVLYGNYTTLAVPLFTLVTTLITPVATAILPTLTSDDARGDGRAFLRTLNEAIGIIAFVSVPCSVFYFSNSHDILTVLFEQGSAILGAPFLCALAPSIILVGPLTVINTALESTGQVKLPVISLIAGTGVKLVLSYALIKNPRVGLLAAPISTLISYLVSFCLSAIFLRIRMKIKIPVFTPSLLPFVLSVIAAAIGAVARYFLPKVGNGRLDSLIILAIIGASYLVLSLLLSKKTRRIVAKYVKMNKKE